MKLSFHGGIKGVTGSCFLLETEQGKILIDCGMYQGERMCSTTNFEDFGFDAKEITAVCVTHAHFDHTGRIPLLFKRGFTGKVFMTAPAKALSRIVLEDALHVMGENAKKCGDPVLYQEADLTKMFANTEGIGYHTQIEPIKGVRILFHDAGHILGSAFITVDVDAELTKDGTAKRIVFTGDVGNEDVPILPKTEEISHADVIVTESTYGDRDHEPVEARQAGLKEMVNKVINRRGTLIIPAFSIERTQELLYEIDQLIDQGEIPLVSIYLDSPLAIRATGIYRDFKHYLRFDRKIHASKDMDFFSFRGLRETLSRDESKRINDDHSPKIIIAGSGMMTGGRVMHHLLRYLSDEKNGVLIIGYQAEETLGRQIEDGAKQVKIYDQTVEVKAEIKKISAFSAHADRNKLAKWLQPEKAPAKQIFLVHGDTETKKNFKIFLEERIKGSTIIIPEVQQEFEV